MLLRLRQYPKTTRAWVAVSLAIMPGHMVLAKPLTLDATALLLTIIAAIYAGFALADSRPVVIIQETTSTSSSCWPYPVFG